MLAAMTISACGVPLVIWGWWRALHYGKGLPLVIVGGLMVYIVPLALIV